MDSKDFMITRETTFGELAERGYTITSPNQRKAQQEYFKRSQYYAADQRHFTQVNDKECSMITNTLTLPQAGTLLAMLAYMEEGEGGFLYFEGKKLSLQEFGKLIGKSHASVKRNVCELVNLGYVTAHKKGRKVFYSVNSQLATRGKKTSTGFFSRLYIVQLREVIERATIQELGFFLFLLPHFNTEFYSVSQTPYEKHFNKVVLLDREQLSEMTGLSLRTVKGLIPSMMRKGLLAGVKTWRTAIVVHPLLVSRNCKKVTLEDLTRVIENEFNKKKGW